MLSKLVAKCCIYHLSMISGLYLKTKAKKPKTLHNFILKHRKSSIAPQHVDWKTMTQENILIVADVSSGLS